MPVKLSDIQAPAPGRSIETAAFGFVIVRSGEDGRAFDAFVSNLIDTPSDDFVVLPVTDGGRGYERVVVLPCEPWASL